VTTYHTLLTPYSSTRSPSCLRVAPLLRADPQTGRQTGRLVVEVLLQWKWHIGDSAVGFRPTREADAIDMLYGALYCWYTYLPILYNYRLVGTPTGWYTVL
jgi:hypothetical protein